MAYQLGSRSLSNLKDVHPHLIRVAKRAIQITKQDFTIIEGRRTLERQKELVSTGASRTMNSRHLTGHAIDIVPWPISWEWEDFVPVVEAMRRAANELGIPVEHGFDWGWDAPHHELSWEHYPK